MREVGIWVNQVTGLEMARLACSYTIGKESTITLEELAKLEHSPLRTVLFTVEMVNIPTFVSVHFVRHSIGVEHYVKSNREDRGADFVADRLTPVNHLMFCNAQALINMARKRLCGKAHVSTQLVMQSIVDNCPEWLQPFLVEECRYRGGWCYERKSCGRYTKYA